MTQRNASPELSYNLCVDTLTHDVVIAEITTFSIGAPEVLAIILRPLRRNIEAISGDGAYDTNQCFSEVAKKKT